MSTSGQSKPSRRLVLIVVAAGIAVLAGPAVVTSIVGTLSDDDREFSLCP
ncbi:MAG: hypothetical protein QOF58_2140, partial [Pseudonocardiales bacterium]|nr:hypothetical protein [Pseudonocardiales bacterium]